MAELHLVPDERVAIQAVLYLAGLAAAHFFLVKPLVSLNRERLRRTLGSSQRAGSDEQKVTQLDADYRARMAESMARARELKQAKIAAGEKEAEALLQSATAKASEQIHRVRAEVEAQLAVQRAAVGRTSADVAKVLLERIMSASSLVMVGLWALGGEFAQAAGGENVDFWYGIFWPYVQFSMFAFGFWYFGRKGFASLLEKKRDALRTQLSEAHQAVRQAEARLQESQRKVASLEADMARLLAEHEADGQRQQEHVMAEALRARDIILRDTERRTNELIEAAREALRKDLVEETMRAVTQQLDPVRLKELNSRLGRAAIDVVRAQSAKPYPSKSPN
jgi:F0F1-type ATP synthase membrane subunit b/b'